MGLWPFGKKKQKASEPAAGDATAAEGDENGPALGFVLTSSPRLPDLAKIVSAIRSFAGGKAVEADPKWDDTNLVVQTGDLMVAVSMMPPYPWKDLEGPCATAWWWPEATERLKSHTNHVLVAILGGEMDRIDRRVLLTHVVRAVLKTTDAVGVYWAEGTVVHEPKTFLEESAKVTAEDLSPHLWIDVRVEQNPDGTFRSFTTGLAPLGFLEIEVKRSKRSPEDLMQFVGDVAAYVVNSRVHVKHGETMGGSAEERIKATHAESMFGRGTVLHLAVP